MRRKFTNRCTQIFKMKDPLGNMVSDRKTLIGVVEEFYANLNLKQDIPHQRTAEKYLKFRIRRYIGKRRVPNPQERTEYLKRR